MPSLQEIRELVSADPKSKYRGTYAKDMYEHFLTGEVGEEEMLCYFQRFWKLKAYGSYRHLGPDICDDIVQQCNLRFLITLRNCVLPPGITGFRRYINRVYWYCLKLYFRKVYDKFIGCPGREFYFGGRKEKRFATSEDVELELFLKELTDTLSTSLMTNIRFEDENEREAVKYAFWQLLNGHRAVPAWMEKFVGDDWRFFLEHALIKIRARLYELKNDGSFYTRPSAFRLSVLQYYKECIGEDEEEEVKCTQQDDPKGWWNG
jgi:hypothetical protein